MKLELFSDQQKAEIEDVKKLKEVGVSIYLALAGGGFTVPKFLWAVEGASSYFIGASTLYHSTDTDKFLGFKPRNYCSTETAISLSWEAYLRAKEATLLDEKIKNNKAIGVGFAVAMATTRELKGGCRYEMAVTTPQGTIVYREELPKQPDMQPLRWWHEKYCYSAILRAIYLAAGIRIPDTGYPVEVEVTETQLEKQFFEYPRFSPLGRTAAPQGYECRKLLLFPGNFDPLHWGHESIAVTAETVAHSSLVYTTEVNPAHKQPIKIPARLDRAASVRIQQTTSRPATILFTNGLPLFYQKMERFKGAGLVMGADTFHRMLEPRWYTEETGEAHSVEGMLSSLAANTSLLVVFDRKNKTTGEFLTSIVANLPEKLPYIWLNTQYDISSTEIREGKKNRG